MNRLIKKILQQIPDSVSVFSVNELAALEPGPDNVRHALVKRAISQGDLIHLRRGLYCLSPLYRKTKINTFAAAQLLYGPSYISLESALSAHGWIPEAVYGITCVSNRAIRDFNTPIGHFSYRKIPQKVLYAGVEMVRDETGQSWYIASALKALADYVFFHRLDWISSAPVTASLRVEMEQLAELTLEDFEELEGNYSSRRVKRFLSGLKKELMA